MQNLQLSQKSSQCRKKQVKSYGLTCRMSGKSERKARMDRRSAYESQPPSDLLNFDNKDLANEYHHHMDEYEGTGFKMIGKKSINHDKLMNCNVRHLK
jgi:hypothetical protein